MCCPITQNWRGQPLVRVVIALIAHTTTRAGLRIRAEIDAGHYPTGTKVSNDELARLSVKRHEFHGGWNYMLLPKRT
ncbi:MAG: hypothetical protein ABIN08_08350 [Caldimonas sp.]